MMPMGSLSMMALASDVSSEEVQSRSRSCLLNTVCPSCALRPMWRDNNGTYMTLLAVRWIFEQFIAYWKEAPLS
jgi:hypothetical protein